MRNTRTTIPWGELVIPLLAVVYTVASLADQMARGLEKSTLLYGAAIGGGVMIFAAISIASVLRKRVEAPAGPLSEEGRAKRNIIVFFLAWTALFILSLDFLGFIITIPSFLFVFFRRMGVREVWKAGSISLGMAAVVYFLFFTWAGMELPLGIMQPLFE